MSSKTKYKPEEQDRLDPKYIILPAYDVIGIENLDQVVLLGVLFFAATDAGAFDHSIDTLAGALGRKYEDVRASLLRLEKNGLITAERQSGKTSIYRIAYDKFGYISDQTGEPVWIQPSKAQAA